MQIASMKNHRPAEVVTTSREATIYRVRYYSLPLSVSPTKIELINKKFRILNSVENHYYLLKRVI